MGRRLPTQWRTPLYAQAKKKNEIPNTLYQWLPLGWFKALLFLSSR